MPKIDIGLIWAKIVNIWGQFGTVAGIANTIMLLVVTYSTTIEPKFHIPLWLYITTIVIAVILGVAFILKWGISGYYRFLSNQSELSQVNKRIELIMKHLNIEDKDVNIKR
jgi:hypothetical protein